MSAITVERGLQILIELDQAAQIVMSLKARLQLELDKAQAAGQQTLSDEQWANLESDYLTEHQTLLDTIARLSPPKPASSGG